MTGRLRVYIFLIIFNLCKNAQIIPDALHAPLPVLGQLGGHLVLLGAGGAGVGGVGGVSVEVVVVADLKIGS